MLARAGVGSRRAVEQLVRSGRVTVNGRPATIGLAVRPPDKVEVDGKPVALSAEKHRYILLNKPAGVVSTLRDPQGRPTIRNLLHDVEERVYPAGRLDLESEGLLLCTNDGELARALTHPSHGLWKTYRVWVEGRPSRETLEALSHGVILEGRKTAPARFKPARVNVSAPESTLLEVELREGRKRQVRKMLEAVGHPVVRLERVAIGPLRDARLPSGRWRELTAREVRELRRAAGLDS